MAEEELEGAQEVAQEGNGDPPASEVGAPEGEGEGDDGDLKDSLPPQERAEPTPEAESNAEPEPGEGEGDPTPEVGKNEPEPEPAVEQGGEATKEPEVEATPETVTEPVAESAPEPNPVPKPEGGEPDPEPQPEQKLEPEAVAEEPGPGPGPEPEPEPEPEQKLEPSPEGSATNKPEPSEGAPTDALEGPAEGAGEEGAKDMGAESGSQSPPPEPAPAPVPVEDNLGRLPFDVNTQGKELADAIEKHSRELSESLVHVTGSLQTNLHALGGMSTEYVRVYQAATASFAENVEASLASMSVFIERVKALNNDLTKMRDLQGEIKGVLTSIDTLDDMASKLIKERKKKRKR